MHTSHLFRFFCPLKYFFILCFFNTIGFGQFTQNAGITGGYIRALAFDGSRLYAGLNQGGLYVSDDMGSSWTKKNIGPNQNNVFSLLVKDNYIFAAAFGIYRSSDKGESWTSITGGLPYFLHGGFTQIDSLIFVAIGSRVYSSSDNGNNWIGRSGGLIIDNYINSIINQDSLLFLGTQNGIFFSSNYGVSWIPRSTSLNLEPVNAMTAAGNKVFASLVNSSIYVSEDQGLNWTYAGNGLPASVLSITCIDSTLFTGPWDKGVYMSTDFGNYWFPVNDGYNPGSSALVFLDAGETVFTGSESGVYQFYKNENLWLEKNTNMFGTEIKCVEFNDGDLYVGRLAGKIYRSSDNGASWEKLNVAQSYAGIDGIAFKGDTICALTEYSVYYSPDNGSNWENYFINSYGFRSIIIKENDIFIGSAQGIWRSTDGGNVWEQKNAGLTDLYITSLSFNDEYLFAGTWNGVFVSSDDGENWSLSLGGMPTGSFIRAIETSGHNVYAGTLGFYVSTDQGSNWIYKGFENIFVLSIAIKDYVVYTGILGEGVLQSTNNGDQWSDISEGLPTEIVYSLEISDTLLFAGTDGFGLWNRSLSLTNSEIPIAQENEFVLAQNYPNPFNPSTRISYSIPEYSSVTIKVFDILGNEIETLVNEGKPAGVYKLTWNAGDLPSGIYFYRLQTGSFVETRKMILMK